jgi:hypothetical protein
MIRRMLLSKPSDSEEANMKEMNTLTKMVGFCRAEYSQQIAGNLEMP